SSRTCCPPSLHSPPSLSPFFFYLRSSPPARRSFPTRRSSDLSTLPVLHRHHRDHVHVLVFARVGHKLVKVSTKLAGGLVTGHARSEEHTSELQSRFDLVCRLLLEKKKH